MLKATVAVLLLLTCIAVTVSGHRLSHDTVISSFPSQKRYDPTWESLDTRPAPPWFDQVKVGIFLHWGVFAVPSFTGGEWFWSYWKDGGKDQVQFMKDNYPPGFTYPNFARDFTAEFYNATQWAELFRDAGARYVVLTAKHHEGFTLWPSKRSFNWNAQDVGPGRDLVGELANATRALDAGATDPPIRFGVYHSLYEWYNPLYLADKQNKFRTQSFVTEKMLPDLRQLVNDYRPDVIWSDGDWEASADYFNSTGFLAWLYNDSPVRSTVLVNDRWGIGVPCKHGDYYNCKDRYNPGVLLPHKWENAMTLDRSSWGYRRTMTAADVLTARELIAQLVQTVSCNGNLLVNVGPRKDGTIDPIFAERLRQMGAWLKVNGEAIYGTRPWRRQNDTIDNSVWFTAAADVVYATILEPTSGPLKIGSIIAADVQSSTRMTVLGSNAEPVSFTPDLQGTIIEVPQPVGESAQLAITIKITDLKKRPATPTD